MQVSEESILIGDLANVLGVTPRTLRLYEKLGLIDAPERTARGARYYGKGCMDQLKFIFELKDLGLTLQEMQELTSRTDCADKTVEVQGLDTLVDKLERNIQDKIANLESLEREIEAYRLKIIDMYSLRL